MSGLFLLFVVAIALIGFGFRKAALLLALINLLLCLAMFWHHITDVLQIAL
jgi:hypothetical protein